GSGTLPTTAARRSASARLTTVSIPRAAIDSPRPSGRAALHRARQTCSHHAQHSLHNSQNAERRVALDHDRLVRGVGGHELDALAPGLVVLPRGFVLDQRDDDLPGARALLLAHHDVVTIVYAGVDHAVAANAKREQRRRVAEQLLG